MNVPEWVVIGYALAGLLFAAWTWERMMSDDNIRKAVDTAPMSYRAAMIALWCMALFMCGLMALVWPVALPLRLIAMATKKK